MASTLCQKWFKEIQLKILLSVVLNVRFVQISLASDTNKFKGTSMERLLTSNISALTTVAGNSFNCKFNAEIDFPIVYFMLQLLMLTLEA